MKRSWITWRKLRKLVALDGGQRRLLLSAFVGLLAVDLGLRTLGFARTRRLLRRRVPSPAARPARWEEVEAVAWAVAIAAGHHLYPMKCITRSTLLEFLLARRGLPGELRIGVGKEAGTFRAHAWIESMGRAVAEPENVEERYASLVLPAP